MNYNIIASPSPSCATYCLGLLQDNKGAHCNNASQVMTRFEIVGDFIYFSSASTLSDNNNNVDWVICIPTSRSLSKYLANEEDDEQKRNHTHNTKIIILIRRLHTVTECVCVLERGHFLWPSGQWSLISNRYLVHS